MFAILISVHGSGAWIRFLDSVHRYSHSEREARDSVPRGVHTYCPLHCSCSSVDSSLAASPSESLQIVSSPTHPCLYIYYSRSMSNTYGSLLSSVAMGLNIPLQGSLFGLPKAMRQANYCCSYLPAHCMRFAWFECGE